jgi:hypothetical protein
MTNPEVSFSLRCIFGSRTFHWVTLVALSALNVLGCSQGSQLDRKPVFGKILGAEGRSGLVTFVPTSGTKGPAASIDFEDGAYRFTKLDGPIAGEFEVSFELEMLASSSAAKRSRRGGKFENTQDDTGGRKLYEPEMSAGAVSVSADGPFEIDLLLAKPETL